ncbi:MAG: putative acylesterase/phospholipase RssA [Candidatus Endobugula sp.]|jgi:predicted acylesterase/phospholipase RssA
MTHKIAIAISGAVSLGSYESGTVYELINAVKLHNAANPDARIEIDVLSGASAGGMTAAMIAQKLLYDGAALEDPIENSLYDVWVNRVDIDDLLNPNLGDDPSKSLLSSNRIGDNAKYVFLTRYEKPNPDVNPHPAAAKTIQLGLALSNLNGVDYDLPIFSSSASGMGQGTFVQTRNQDRYTTEVNQQCDNVDYWTEVMTAGRACGAFPLAFRPIPVKREWDTLDYKGLGAKNWAGLFNGQFTYADGGIFNNYPLGLARDLSRRVDSSAADADKRFYFYISPDAKTSSADYAFSAESANMVQSMGQIVKSILSNSRFQDWVQTDNVNGEIDKLHRRAKGLLEVVLTADAEQLNAMSTTSEKFCQLLYIENDGNYQQDYNRAEDTFSRYIADDVSMSDEQKMVWLNSILVMEVNANLTGKDKMSIYTITAEAAELASSPIAAFFGFLDVRFRKHDYLVGRLKARQTINHIITSVQQGADNQLPLKIDLLDNTVLEAELKTMSALRNASMADVAQETREKLYTRLKSRSRLIMKSLGLNLLVRSLVLQLVLKGKIKQFLQL